MFNPLSLAFKRNIELPFPDTMTRWPLSLNPLAAVTIHFSPPPHLWEEIELLKNIFNFLAMRLNQIEYHKDVGTNHHCHIIHYGSPFQRCDPYQ